MKQNLEVGKVYSYRYMSSFNNRSGYVIIFKFVSKDENILRTYLHYHTGEGFRIVCDDAYRIPNDLKFEEL